MNVLPAIVSVPLRLDVDVFAVAVYPTVPLPEPLAPAVMVIHEAPLDAVHAQADGSVTETVPWAPLAATEAVRGDSVASHTIPACVIVNVCPPAVMVPLRLDTVVLAAIE